MGWEQRARTAAKNDAKRERKIARLERQIEAIETEARGLLLRGKLKERAHLKEGLWELRNKKWQLEKRT